MMSPLVPEGSVTTSGSRKHMASNAMRIPACTQSRSARPTRGVRSPRVPASDGTGGASRVASVASGSGAAIPDPWVEYRVAQVGDEVAEHGHQREDQRDP